MSFRLLQPDKYKAIANQLDAKKDARKRQINEIIPVIAEKIKSFGVKAEISGRAKHSYSIYQKMEAKQLDIEEINDLLGIRIIVGKEEDCYNVQGILHEDWLPITTDYEGQAGRDWIVHPKENLYQSLYTTICIKDKIVEVQKNGDIVELITTRARKGPSAEWLSRSKDKEGKSTYIFARTPQARGKIRHWFKEHKDQ